MSGVSRILADTNIIILAIGGNQKARHLLEGNILYISAITEIELLSIPFVSSHEEKLMVEFISNCYIVDLDNEVKRQTIFLRKRTKIKLPDAIIAASSIAKELPLFTADKGFGKISGLNYTLFSPGIKEAQ
jgi:predicted nucleic acid-binding protein